MGSNGKNQLDEKRKDVDTTIKAGSSAWYLHITTLEESKYPSHSKYSLCVLVCVLSFKEMTDSMATA